MCHAKDFKISQEMSDFWLFYQLLRHIILQVYLGLVFQVRVMKLVLKF
jgi:hypothetical protein